MGIAGVAGALLLGSVAAVHTQQRTSPIDIVKVHGQVYLLAGPAGNTLDPGRRARASSSSTRCASRTPTRCSTRDQEGRRRQADSLRRQHARARRSHGRQPEDRPGRLAAGRRQLRAAARRGRREERVHRRSRERAQGDERADGRRGALAVRRVADRHVLPGRKGSVLQRGRHSAGARAGGAHRRRHPRVLPELGCDRDRRRVQHRRATRRSTWRAAATSTASSRR